MAVDKTVYQIYFKGNYAYLSCGFGVVVLNTKNMEISDTYIIGDDAAMKPVYGFASDDTYFYALMDDKIKRAKVSGVNLLDYNNWEEGQILLPDESAAFRNLYYYSNCIVVSKTKHLHINMMASHGKYFMITLSKKLIYQFQMIICLYVTNHHFTYIQIPGPKKA